MGALLFFVWLVLLWPLATIATAIGGLAFSYSLFMSGDSEGFILAVVVLLLTTCMVMVIPAFCLPVGALMFGKSSIVIWIGQTVLFVLGMVGYLFWTYPWLLWIVAGIIALPILLGIVFKRWLIPWCQKHEEEDREYFRARE